MRPRPMVFVLAVGCIAVPLALVAALLLAAAAAALAAQNGGSGLPYVAAICVYAATTVVRPLAARLAGPDAEGVVVDAGRSPHLRALAAGMDELRLTLQATAVVSKEGERRTMTVGLPLVAALDASALRARIALAIAGHDVADTRFERFALRAWQRMQCV